MEETIIVTTITTTESYEEEEISLDRLRRRSRWTMAMNGMPLNEKQ